jgi:predicted metal-dependent peptidase
MSNREQAARMDQAALNLVFSQPFFGTLLLHLKRVEVTPDHALAGRIHTMAVDGTHLFWAPAFVAQLSKAQIMGVLAHEVMHCALRHFLRMESRDPSRWNQATDFAINRDILLGGFALPETWEANGRQCSPCVDKKGEFKGLDSEAIYNRLQSQPKPQGGPGKPGDGSPSPTNGQGQASGEPGDGEPGNGEPGAGEASGGLPEGIGEGLGDVMPGEGTQAAQDDIAADWQIRTMQAAKQADKSKGFVPGMVREAIAELMRPQVDWRERLRDFVGQAMASEASWSRPQKRLVSRGLWLPSCPRDNVSKLLFVADTSGSMSAKELTAAFSEAQAMLDEGGLVSLIWACADTRIASHGELESGDSFAGFQVSGRGGTSFAAPMAWVAEQVAADSDIAACVYFTDGDTNSWGRDPGIPMLWIGADRYRRTIEQAPYGETVVIKL